MPKFSVELQVLTPEYLDSLLDTPEAERVRVDFEDALAADRLPLAGGAKIHGSPGAVTAMLALVMLETKPVRKIIKQAVKTLKFTKKQVPGLLPKKERKRLVQQMLARTVQHFASQGMADETADEPDNSPTDDKAPTDANG